MSDVRSCKGGTVRTESKDLAPHHHFSFLIQTKLSPAIHGRHAPRANPEPCTPNPEPFIMSETDDLKEITILELEMIVTEAQAGRMVKDAVKVLHLSGGLWKRIKWNGRVTVNGEEVHNARRRVTKGDRIVLTWSEENDIVPSDIPLSITYEDEALLIVNKGPGMIIHPTARGAHDTLVNAVAGYYAQRHIEAGIHPIYRLDRNTTGLVVVAKSAKGQYDLSKSHDQIYREYLALVSGHMDEKAGRIDRPIGRRDGSIVEWMVREDGKRAITDYEVLGEYDGYSLLKIHLLTGRTHQIRVHFASLGHPLLGDDLYGGPLGLMTRQALHAYTVRFAHPVTGREMRFTAPVPEDMRAWMGKNEE